MNGESQVEASRLVGRGITKRFGSQIALDRVNFEFVGGEVSGVLGANGAGKSTLLKILAGAITPDEGDLVLDGQVVRMNSMRDANERGIALVSQELSLFPALTVRENFEIVRSNAVRHPRAVRDSHARRILSELGLEIQLSHTVGRLSLSDRQLVEIARALLQEPHLLILDEPTSALHEVEKSRLLTVIQRLRDRGVGIVYVSHFLEEVLEVADTLVVLRDGKRVSTHFEPAKERLPDLVLAMLGEKFAPDGCLDDGVPRPWRSSKVAAGGKPLVLTGVRGPAQLFIPSWTVPPGEVNGIAGLVGCGIEELFAILFGGTRATSGTIELPSGRPAPRSIHDAVESGVAFVPADRKRVGLALEQSIAENISAVRSLVKKTDGLVLRQRDSEKVARERCSALKIKSSSVWQRVAALSGGNQQKVVFAKWWEAKPSLVLLDDPTRGVDVGAKREMHEIIWSMADRGCVVLMHSSDPLELVNVCTRVHIFVNGSLRTPLEGAELTEHGLVSAMNQRACVANRSVMGGSCGMSAT
jgi:ABC-type sugar transport system ATPase subunit